MFNTFELTSYFNFTVKICIEMFITLPCPTLSLQFIPCRILWKKIAQKCRVKYVVDERKTRCCAISQNPLNALCVEIENY